MVSAMATVNSLFGDPLPVPSSPINDKARCVEDDGLPLGCHFGADNIRQDSAVSTRRFDKMGKIASTEVHSMDYNGGSAR